MDGPVCAMAQFAASLDMGLQEVKDFQSMSANE
jgi:hypothetical protein